MQVIHPPKGWRSSLLLVVSLAALACKSGNGSEQGEGETGDEGGDPVPVEPGEFTYTLQESPDGLTLWTTPATHKLRTMDRAPDETHEGLRLSAARGEFEPIQIVADPAAGTLAASIDPFPQLGANQRLTLARVGFDGGWADPLTPLADGASIDLSSTDPTAIWLTVYVPTDAPPGEHVTNLQLDGAFGSVAIPVTLYVFDFDMPASSPFATQFNVDIASLIPDGGTVDDAKDLLFEHRLSPTSVTWPSGFNWAITWENGDAPCEQFWDEPTEADEYSIGALSRRYILGEGWNGIGFPIAMLFQFVDNSTPRPDTFCGIDRGDHDGTDAYNAEWQQWLTALEAYLTTNGLVDKSYYYVQNEPQDDADHALAAHLCRLTKAAAPNLKIAVSDEPKPEIAEDPGGASGYDIWIAHIQAYNEDYAWIRKRDFGETVWFYSLDPDPDPFFNPTRVDLDGMHARIIPWNIAADLVERGRKGAGRLFSQFSGSRGRAGRTSRIPASRCTGMTTSMGIARSRDRTCTMIMGEIAYSNSSWKTGCIGSPRPSGGRGLRTRTIHTICGSRAWSWSTTSRPPMRSRSWFARSMSS